MTSACIIGIGGYSGAGKTTLIEKALPLLRGRGLSVGVLKHTSHHALSADTPGKDTDRFYKAGADFVAGQDTAQWFGRRPLDSGSLQEGLSLFPLALDLILVEGHKGSDVPRIWLDAEGSGSEGLPDAGAVRARIEREDPLYLDKFLEYVTRELDAHLVSRPVFAGLLIGGKSSRMGRPKTMLEIGGRTLAEQMVGTLSLVASRTVLLGNSQLADSLVVADRIPDIQETEGPLAGMLSAFRWAPRSAWIISSVDMPLMHEKAWRWLLAQRRPGTWAVMPQIQGSGIVEAAGACYEPMLFDYAESIALKRLPRLQELARHPKVLRPVIPPELAPAWKNVNTPDEWAEVKSLLND
ncbi:MAG: molybdopterin-guanine dinucleotide biosynthesis protein B [Nitrospiraceae bacterium]|nr:molybdopterin-guanine dinucleotide biosynthesis protein B [Nitrospiraceae bacterium]